MWSIYTFKSQYFQTQEFQEFLGTSTESPLCFFIKIPLYYNMAFEECYLPYKFTFYKRFFYSALAITR
jgi:hypothetical protein